MHTATRALTSQATSPTSPAGISLAPTTAGELAGPAGGCGVGGAERNSCPAPSAPLANVKCLQTEKNRPERLFRLEINVTEKCRSRAINAAFFATYYVSALKREGRVFGMFLTCLAQSERRKEEPGAREPGVGGCGAVPQRPGRVRQGPWVQGLGGVPTKSPQDLGGGMVGPTRPTALGGCAAGWAEAPGSAALAKGGTRPKQPQHSQESCAHTALGW